MNSSQQFIACPSFGTHIIQRNDAERIIVVDHTTCISFTPTEYNLLCLLLSGYMIRDNELSQAAAGCSVEQWKRTNLKRYIDKIRYKVRPAGLSIHRISGYGYVLQASEIPTSQQEG